jgi:hypothetical protein
MERVVNIEIVVDLENPAAEYWESVTDFFESEVDEVLRKVTSYSKRGYSKHQSEQGTTKGGSKFKLSIRKRLAWMENKKKK